jgi:hypothetical protein
MQEGVRKPWFKPNKSGGLPMPAGLHGWAIVVVFVATILGSAWLPKSVATPFRIICGMAFLGSCLALTDWRSSGP